MKLWRGQPDNFKPSPMAPKDKRNLWLGLSGVFYLLGINSYIWPPTVRATGRWSWIHHVFFDLFGSSGDFVLFLVAGTGALLAALSQHSKHTRQRSQP